MKPLVMVTSPMIDNQLSMSYKYCSVFGLKTHFQKLKQTSLYLINVR